MPNLAQHRRFYAIYEKPRVWWAHQPPCRERIKSPTCTYTRSGAVGDVGLSWPDAGVTGDIPEPDIGLQNKSALNGNCATYLYLLPGGKEGQVWSFFLVCTDRLLMKCYGREAECKSSNASSHSLLEVFCEI